MKPMISLHDAQPSFTASTKHHVHAPVASFVPERARVSALVCASDDPLRQTTRPPTASSGGAAKALRGARHIAQSMARTLPVRSVTCVGEMGRARVCIFSRVSAEKVARAQRRRRNSTHCWHVLSSSLSRAGTRALGHARTHRERTCVLSHPQPVARGVGAAAQEGQVEHRAGVARVDHRRELRPRGARRLDEQRVHLVVDDLVLAAVVVDGDERRVVPMVGRARVRAGGCGSQRARVK